MPADIQDWTDAVVVTGGTVTIAGTASVSIAGTPTVSIAGTPAVSISGTATVIFPAGSPQSVSLSGTNTVNIGNTPAVTISGTPTVQFAAGQSVSITGTATVTFAAGQSVSITGTPTIQFAAGQTVTISGTSAVNISGQSITVNTALQSSFMQSYTANAGAYTSAQLTLPAGTVAVLVQWSASASVSGTGGQWKVTGVTTGTNYVNVSLGNQISTLWSSYLLCPVSQASDSKITVTTNFAGTTTVYVTALLAPFTPSTQPVLGVIGGQPVVVEESTATVTSFKINNSVSAAQLNITPNTQNVREVGFSWFGATATGGLYLNSFGGSPIQVWGGVITATGNGNIAPQDCHRLTAPSGLNIPVAAGSGTIIGTIIVDTDQ